MTTIHSFPASADSSSRILILGSMPGVESLRQQQYYAHPRNLFWRLMEELLDVDREQPYQQRLSALRARGIALWDSAHSCVREGSLDSNITAVVANDFISLLDRCPQIHTIFFNGNKSAALFDRLVLPKLNHNIKRITLPSTSPANASVSAAAKRAAWQQVPNALQSRISTEENLCSQPRPQRDK